jgi:hypothetical protein
MLMRSALFWDITQRRMVILYRRFGTTYPSFLLLKLGPIGCPETSVKDYHSTLRNIPEERGSQRSPIFFIALYPIRVNQTRGIAELIELNTEVERIWSDGRPIGGNHRHLP